MSLRSLPLKVEYRSGSANLVSGFYAPCFSQSTRYWRAVGYFTSSGLTTSARGLARFLESGGTMRLVASPYLEDEDIDAITSGYERRAVLENAVLRQFPNPSQVDQVTGNRLSCLAWLVAERRLEVKVAFCMADVRKGMRPGIYHEKCGLFLDEDDNCVAFTGSPNETKGGLVDNFECIDVFTSWSDPERVSLKRSNFEALWENCTPRLEVYEFSSVLDRLEQYRTATRPGSDPEESESGHGLRATIPAIPAGLELRSYQRSAIQSWVNSDYRGILSMATGSGKTITALTAAAELHHKVGRQFLLVACPYKHLVDQWVAEARKFGYRPLAAYESVADWSVPVGSNLVDFNLGYRTTACVITTYATLSSPACQEALGRVDGPALIIADEAHHVGASRLAEGLPANFCYRLGLSATPERWFDDEGTRRIHDYFGPTVFEFGLSEAIAAGCLTPYEYHPHLVELTDDELETYITLSRKIAKLWNSGPDHNEQLQALLRKRSDVLNQAEEKLGVLAELVAQDAQMSHTLFYCAPGQHEQVTSLLGNQLGLRVHPFTAKESLSTRRQLLDNFASGRLQALVAIRCLDEGVDVPATRQAFLLASSSNPREFIQRRGRILRRAPGKDRAILHDLITVPPLSSRGSSTFGIERSILKRELSRFMEFADTATNRFTARQVLWDMMKAYGLLDMTAEG